jgi:taspase (threonine aspartase 1)
MTFLKNGGTAVDAVEVALMVLEDDPITNAGYGSNLNHDGVVECDASIMDHRGKSGAAGAVPSKLVVYLLKCQSQHILIYKCLDVKNPIALARKIYDQSNKKLGMSRVPPNFIVGEGARDFAWENGVIVLPNEDMIHAVAGQRWKSWKQDVEEFERDTSNRTAAPWLHRPLTPMQTRLEKLQECEKLAAIDREAAEETMSDWPASTSGGHPSSSRDGSPDMETDIEIDGEGKAGNSGEDSPDMITDTIGAIAVDKWGNIAAGSSSGGIGMKHRGRVGPAALIGIGTHVVPVDPSDPEQVTVACVTSGTGELIASAFVAHTLAQRIYFGQRKCENGEFEQEVDQVVIAETFKNEFTRTYLRFFPYPVLIYRVTVDANIIGTSRVPRRFG